MVLENLIQFNADSLAGFILTNSFVGLGLVIAIYAFLSPHITDLIGKRQNKLLKLISERNKVWKSMSKNKESIPLTKKYKEIQKRTNSLKRIPFHFDLGYQITAILFFYSLTITLFKLIFPIMSLEKAFGYLSFLFFVLGAMIFSMSLIFLIVDIRELTRDKFNKIIEKEEEKEEKIEKEVKKKPNRLKKSKKKTFGRIRHIIDLGNH